MNILVVNRGVCRDPECSGARLDDAGDGSGEAERAIHAADSAVQIRVIPTDEEIITARAGARLTGAA